MDIKTKIEKVLESNGNELKNSEEYTRLKNFITQMKSKGIIVPQKYNLPPIDRTVQ